MDWENIIARPDLDDNDHEQMGIVERGSIAHIQVGDKIIEVDEYEFFVNKRFVYIRKPDDSFDA